MEYLFWVSLFLIFYAYAGYPSVLWLLTMLLPARKLRNTKAGAAVVQPAVTLVISAYNEQDVIEEKIRNALALDYPEELLEIVVVSDGSRDDTDRIVQSYANRGVVLRRYEGRIGKTACLNRAVPAARGDVIVFSDANALYDRGAVGELARHFENPAIGFVTGGTSYISSHQNANVIEPIGVYMRLEQITKKLESAVGSCVGADGAIFAIRKGLYRTLQDSDINDLVIPLGIIARGFRGIYEARAVCSERVAKSMEGEFRRQVRITSRTIRAIINYRSLLNPFWYGLFSFELISHKVCKLCSPFFLIAAFVANLLLAFDLPFYRIPLLGQAALYGLAMVYSLNRKSSSSLPFLAIPATFAAANGAILVGWLKYFQGERYTTWHTGR